MVAEELQVYLAKPNKAPVVKVWQLFYSFLHKCHFRSTLPELYRQICAPESLMDDGGQIWLGLCFRCEFQWAVKTPGKEEKLVGSHTETQYQNCWSFVCFAFFYFLMEVEGWWYSHVKSRNRQTHEITKSESMLLLQAMRKMFHEFCTLFNYLQRLHPLQVSIYF